MRIPVLAAVAAACLLLLNVPATAQDPATEPTIEKEVLATGEGEVCGNGRVAVVHYTGTFTNGKKFDSSRDRGEPLVVEVGAGRVIKGWDQTLAQMRKGDRWKVTIPWQLAYGADGREPAIPAKTDLVFDMEMLDILAPEIEYVTHGKGEELAPGDLVEAHVTASLATGEIWRDSRAENAEPVMLQVGSRSGIAGLDMALKTLRVGDRVRIAVPSAIALGKRGSPPKIPPDADLAFDIEVLAVLEPKIVWQAHGRGEKPKRGQRVTVHYAGTLPDGTKFVDTRETLKPMRYIVGVGQMIAGLDLTVIQMQPGDRVTVTIPHQLARGSERMSSTIPEKTDLTFDLELLTVE